MELANRRFVPQRVRRPMLWTVATGRQVVTTGASTVSTILTEASAEAFPVPTLVRIRGSLVCQATSFAATPGRMTAFMGIKVVSAAALAGSAVSLPFDDGSQDWIWWTAVPLILTSGSITTPTGPRPFLQSERVMVDSKSMRKIPGDSVLVLVSENEVVTSTGTFDVQFGLRLLLKR